MGKATHWQRYKKGYKSTYNVIKRYEVLKKSNVTNIRRRKKRQKNIKINKAQK